MKKIARVYTRHYRDNGQRTAYVEWSDGSRTEGSAYELWGILIPASTTMEQLFNRAQREGLTIAHEVW